VYAVIDTDEHVSQSLDLAMAGDRYTVTAKNLSDAGVQLNGTKLKLGTDDALPR
jgi:hypothetical protein